MNRHTRGLVAAFLMLAGVLLAFPSRALAYDCNALVVDDAGAFGSDIGRVQAAAQKLADAGALVRVRTVQDFGGFADLDAYEFDHWSNCKGWRSLDGQGDKSNLLALFFSFDDDQQTQRDYGFYFGDAWKPQLTGKDVKILTDFAKPKLLDGDNADAVIAALSEAGKLISAPAAVTMSSSGNAPVVVVQQPAAPSQPTDLSGLWNVMWGVLLLVLVVGIVALVVTWRRKVAETRQAQQEAKLAMQACVQHVTTAEQPLVLAEAKVGGQKGKFAPADIQPMLDTLAAARRALMAAQTEYGELQGMDVNPDKDGLSKGEYDNLAERYNALLAKFRAATADVNGIDASITELTALAASADAAIDAAGGAIETAGARIAAVEQAGFRVEGANAVLEKAVDALAQAEDAVKAKSFGQMKDKLVEANRLANQAAEQAEAQKREKAGIDTEVRLLRSSSKDADGTLDSARMVFDQIREAYAPVSWDSITGNGSQAEAALDAADEAVDAAEQAATMDAQDWATARGKLQEARQGIQRAEALANAIVTLKRDLDAAKDAAPREIEAAAADIAAARKYIASHDADIDDGLETRLDAAERRLDEARELLTQAQPDYRAVVKAALAVNETADAVLSTSKEQHQAAERKRRLAVSTMEEAERSVNTARQYINAHRSDVDSDAEARLAEAVSSLSSASRASNLDSQIKFAKAADEAADNALDMAKKDVRREQKEREQAAEAAAALIRAATTPSRPAHTPTPAYRPSPSPSPSPGRGGGAAGGYGGAGRGGGAAGGIGRAGRNGGSAGGW